MLSLYSVAYKHISRIYVATLKDKEVINLKKRKEKCMGDFGGRKGNEKCNYNLKN